MGIDSGIRKTPFRDNRIKRKGILPGFYFRQGAFCYAIYLEKTFSSRSTVLSAPCASSTKQGKGWQNFLPVVHSALRRKVDWKLEVLCNIITTFADRITWRMKSAGVVCSAADKKQHSLFCKKVPNNLHRQADVSGIAIYGIKLDR